jgi:CheY-like chemotaxis protein
MLRLLFIHWNQAEAEARAKDLRDAGHQVEIYFQPQGTGYRNFRDNPPEVFVISLDRIPSHGRALATYFRQQKATRHVPIVFVGGEKEKAKQTRALLPDAIYTEWSDIRTAIQKSVKNPPRTPIVPGTMAGYSGTPLPKKLGIRGGSVVVLLGAPTNFVRKLAPLPESVRLAKQARSANVALLFVTSQAELKRRFLAVGRVMAEKAALWVVWPKQASGVKTDLSEKVVRAYGLSQSWVDYKICAVDETWSGLCFARRKPKTT